MIGQCNLQSRIEQLIENNTFPRFSILVGPKGSGKKTFANWIITKIVRQEALSYSHVCQDVKIDTIRQIIEGAYKTISTNIYVIPDADNMSNAAKNALLKVTEEPPNNAYFIMTLEDENNTLETIKSRAVIFHMDEYTKQDLITYATSKDSKLTTNLLDSLYSVCLTPGDVDTLLKYDVGEFFQYINSVVDNIAQVSTANALKIPVKVGPDGYDLRLFLRAVGSTFIRRSLHADFCDNDPYLTAYTVTSQYLRELRITGINKQMLLDNWVLAIREVLQ